MITLHALPHDRLELTASEAGDIDQLRSTPWARAGVARVVETRIGVELRVGPYVGRLVAPGHFVIEVNEPFIGTVSTCLALSRSGRRWGFQPSTPSRLNMSAPTALAAEFATDLSAYVTGGIERRYVSRTVRTTRPRGRIDVARTVGLMARGRKDEVVCTVRPLTDDTPLNRALISAITRAEQLLLRANQTAALRALRRSSVALSGVARDRVPDFRTLQVELPAERGDWRRLLGLAELLVTGVPVLPRSSPDAARAPASAWINVERVFEEAVRAVFAEIVGVQGRVASGGDTPLFRRAPDDPPPIDKSAAPDVVIRLPSGTTVLADAKYRRHAAEVEEDELYQLIAHADAYDAAAAALVAPARPTNSGGSYRWLGRGANGTAYQLISVDPSSPQGMITPIRSWMARFMPL